MLNSVCALPPSPATLHLFLGFTPRRKWVFYFMEHLKLRMVNNVSNRKLNRGNKNEEIAPSLSAYSLDISLSFRSMDQTEMFLFVLGFKRLNVALVHAPSFG